MTHDDDLFSGLHDLPQRLCLDTSLDSCVALDLLATHTVVRNLPLVLDDRLGAAASQGQINCHPGKLCILDVGGTTRTEAHTQRNLQFVSCLGRLNILKDREFVLFQPRQILLLENHKELVTIQFSHNGIDILEIFVDLSINDGGQQ